MIGVKMGEEMNECAFGERLAEIKIIHDDVGVCDYSGHIGLSIYLTSL